MPRVHRESPCVFYREKMLPEDKRQSWVSVHGHIPTEGPPDLQQKLQDLVQQPADKGSHRLWWGVGPLRKKLC